MPTPNDTQSIAAETASGPRRQLSLLDSTCIIVGIIIGSGIYELTPLIASNVSSPGMLLGVWLSGGVVAFAGALCYAELATAYPRSGGDYVFLSRAYGSRFAFLFAWAEFWIVRPGNIGMISYVFGRYAQQIWPLESVVSEEVAITGFACTAIVLLSAMNLWGIRAGTRTQNTLTVLKVLGLLGICVLGLSTVGLRPDENVASTTASASQANFPMALLFVLFCFGGWNEMSYVAAEVRNPEANIVRALLLGTCSTLLVYLVVNLAFLKSMGLPGMTASAALATDVVRPRLGEYAARAISLLICLTCLGAINGMLFTGSRIYYAVGTEHAWFSWLGRWQHRFGGPVRALLLQSFGTLALVITASAISPGGGFETLFLFSAPVYWGFAIFVALALFILRIRNPNSAHVHRVWLFPIPPLIFLGSACYLAYSGLTYAIAHEELRLSLWAVAILVVGAVVAFGKPIDQSADPGA
ncbi:MAG: amino acid permease [Planctomycetaceae bacterium]|nr:amino acid permease [Planctomycetaceae bacterium]|tara:strand:+ start:1450 stop:2859 length:1410 start_codon:yes stop_codon:yes gene_type:complete